MSRLMIALALSAALLACRPASSDAPAIKSSGVQASAAPAKAAKAGHNCEDLGTPEKDEVATLKDPQTGATVLATGDKLAGAQAVSVAELLANPEAFAGKTVRLEGNVSAMCTHRRAWFSVQSDDRSGGYVRIIAAPKFLVPEGSIGKRARTEGVVEIVEVPKEQAEHYAAEHQLPPQFKAPVLRATGAEFI